MTAILEFQPDSTLQLVGLRPGEAIVVIDDGEPTSLAVDQLDDLGRSRGDAALVARWLASHYRRFERESRFLRSCGRTVDHISIGAYHDCTHCNTGQHAVAQVIQHMQAMDARACASSDAEIAKRHREQEAARAYAAAIKALRERHPQWSSQQVYAAASTVAARAYQEC